MFGKLYWIIPTIINRAKMNSISNAEIDKSVKTYGRILFKVSNTSFLKIGENTIIRSSWRSNPAGGGQRNCIIALRDGACLDIGKNVGISNSTIYCHEKIIIEDNVMIGVNCVIYDTDFHSVNLDNRLNGNTNIKHSPVTICEGSWIGGHSIILKGVTVGKHSVVGAGSVVTKDIPSGEIWAGNPARFIRRVDE